MKHRMSFRLAGAALAIAIVSAACSGGAEAGGVAASDPVPDTSFRSFAGEEISLASYAGQPVVVNFWASWCPSCVAELSAAFRPAQQALGGEVAFVGVNIQDERGKALDLVTETGVLFDLAEDADGDLYTALGGLGMPFTVFVSAAGEIVGRHNGPLSEQQLLDRIDDLLLS
jgi:thiol-disulfide isomerase/thioredoxin